VHDAHFKDFTMSIAYEDWGHSCWHQAALVAKTAGARALALFHYAPSLSDAELDAIAESVRREFPTAFPAYEGQEVFLAGA
jgi:ribonuclease BN (tRNA processing enzyme)